MRKNSRYTKFFKHVINDFKENGQLYIINERKSKKIDNCQPLIKEGSPLGVSKLAFLFFILSIGISMRNHS